MKKLMLILVLLFTCNAWSSENWSPPVDLEMPPAGFIGEGVIPQIAVDADGNAFAAWCSNDGVDNIVKAARYDAATETWGPAVQIGVGNSENAILSVTTDGKALVVWDRSTDLGSIIQYNSYVGGWRGEGSVDPTGPMSQIHARIGVNGTEKAMGVWASPAGPTGDTIRGGIYDFASDSWSNTDITTTSPASFVGQPDIAVSASGSTKAIAVWRYRDEGTPDFRIQSSVYTNSWSPVVDIASSTTDQLIIPIIEISNDGSTAIANWIQTPNMLDYVVMGSVYTGSWSVPLQLSPNPGHIPLGAEKGLVFYSIAFDASGDAVDVWMFVDDTIPASVIQARTFQNSTWSASQDISNSTGSFPQVALNSAGNGWAVWMDGDGITFNPPITILATPFTKADNTWGTSEVISTSDFNFLPNIGSNALGQMFADWGDMANGGLIQAARLLVVPPIPPVPPVVLPPASISGKQVYNRFAMQSERFNEIKWSSSPTPDVVSYLIFRDGVLIATVASTTLSYKDHNIKSGQSYTYSIVAVDLNGIESVSITITVPFP